MVICEGPSIDSTASRFILLLELASSFVDLLFAFPLLNLTDSSVLSLNNNVTLESTFVWSTHYALCSESQCLLVHLTRPRWRSDTDPGDIRLRRVYTHTHNQYMCLESDWFPVRTRLLTKFERFITQKDHAAYAKDVEGASHFVTLTCMWRATKAASCLHVLNTIVPIFKIPHICGTINKIIINIVCIVSVITMSFCFTKLPILPTSLLYVSLSVQNRTICNLNMSGVVSILFTSHLQ